MGGAFVWWMGAAGARRPRPMLGAGGGKGSKVFAADARGWTAGHRTGEAPQALVTRGLAVQDMPAPGLSALLISQIFAARGKTRGVAARATFRASAPPGHDSDSPRRHDGTKAPPSCLVRPSCLRGESLQYSDGDRRPEARTDFTSSGYGLWLRPLGRAACICVHPRQKPCLLCRVPHR
jgi:hypothetical protein